MAENSPQNRASRAHKDDWECGHHRRRGGGSRAGGGIDPAGRLLHQHSPHVGTALLPHAGKNVNHRYFHFLKKIYLAVMTLLLPSTAATEQQLLARHEVPQPGLPVGLRRGGAHESREGRFYRGRTVLLKDKQKIHSPTIGGGARPPRRLLDIAHMHLMSQGLKWKEEKYPFKKNNINGHSLHNVVMHFPSVFLNLSVWKQTEMCCCIILL